MKGSAAIITITTGTAGVMDMRITGALGTDRGLRSMPVTGLFHVPDEARSILGGHERGDLLVMTPGFLAIVGRACGKRAAAAMEVEFDLPDAGGLCFIDVIKRLPFLHGFLDGGFLPLHAGDVEKQRQHRQRSQKSASELNLFRSGEGGGL